ncbi:hypothetical protein B9Z55_000725 [Caenorhabditis nigoni]|uniref:DNA-directed DNA polymerase n=1 Tax=Caenorhabditis nigoni TaxID=1611254 RepID=A0A2G5VV65_9PELO|nr:hypothetical protein B9Z55_000725 [Caenorhabditis nigoni]
MMPKKMKWNDPQAIEETIEEVRSKVKILTGGGRRYIKTLKQVAVDFENGDGARFMTGNEIEEMKNHLIFEHEPKFLFRNERRVSLPEIRLRFKNKIDSPELMQRTLDQFIRYCIGKSGGDLDKSKMSFGFFHQGFHAEKGFWINERTYQTFNGQVLFEELERITQSKEEIDIDDSFMITMHYFDEQLKIPTNVIGMGKCLPKAIALAMIQISLKQEKDEEQRKIFQLEWDRMVQKKYNGTNEKRQIEAANKILEKANLNTMKHSFDFDDLDKIAFAFPDYKFEVYNRPSYEKIYHLIKEWNTDAEKIVTIAFKKEDDLGHYDYLRPSLLYMKTIFCHKCKKKTASTGHQQVCDAICDKCGFYECDRTQIETVYCGLCNTNFPNEDCFNGHLELAYNSRKTMCEKRYTCEVCNFRVFKDKMAQGEVHECSKKVRCRQCKQLFDKTQEHDCCFAIPRAKYKEKTLANKIICYDVESIVTNSPNGPDPSKPPPIHKVNLICYKICCNQCIEDGESCECVSGNFSYTEYQDPLLAFVEFLLYNSNLDGAHVLAHNGGRYDHNFVLSLMMSSFGIIPEYVSNGTSLIMANITNLRRRNDEYNCLKFLDSLRFIPMPLSKMPKTFGITEMKKGYYPYYFNHPENYGKIFIGLPARHFYDPEHMKADALAEFSKWYDEHELDIFNADQELLAYCQSDVEILTAAISEYIKICKKLFKGWNPILSSCTIAGFVKHILKFEHFEYGDLGIIPENGFPERNNSVLALKMLMWIEKQEGIVIQHKLRGPEKMIRMEDEDCFFVDGYDGKTNTVYEINGCFYHGCPKCFNPILPHPNDPTVENKSVYDATKRRETKIKENGYNVIVWWEHEIKEMLRVNLEMRMFFEKCRHTTHLIPREGMYGGRTQTFQMFVDCNDDEECLYFCSILPPPDIKIPVLPYKIPGFLTFPSCRSCVEKNNNRACTHEKISDRYLTGIWTHVELNIAIERGYRLLKYHEIWWWPDNKWVEPGYFSNYLKPMIRLKHESSGWPKENMTDDEKKVYIDKIEQRDGVRLNSENVRKADNMREMAKLFLNTCWGKFAENPIKHESKLFNTIDHLSQSDYMGNPAYEVTGIKDWDEGITLITRRAKVESVTTREFTNVVIGIFTTSYARVRLLQAMEAVGAENLIYADTDSVIYKKKVNNPSPVGALIGDGLGKLKSEIPNGYQMKKCVSMGSKVYSYRLVNMETSEEKIVTKFKGVVLNASSGRVINMTTMESSVNETFFRTYKKVF